MDGLVEFESDLKKTETLHVIITCKGLLEVNSVLPLWSEKELKILI